MAKKNVKLKYIEYDKGFGNFLVVRKNAFTRDIPGPGEYDVTVKCRVKVTQVHGDTMLFSTNSFFDAEFETPWKMRTLNQNSTLRGIEYFIAWANFDHRPNEEEKEIIHEALLELYAPEEMNPVTGSMQPKRTRRMSRKEMSLMIHHSLNHLAEMEIPHALKVAMGNDIQDLFVKWYEWQNSQEVSSLIDDDMTWNQYKAMQKVCEFTFTHEGDGIKLDQMHIVSRGAENSAIDEPWNWIRGRREIHQMQHQHGWEHVLRLYPHMRGKVERARMLAHKRGLAE